MSIKSSHPTQLCYTSPCTAIFGVLSIISLTATCMLTPSRAQAEETIPGASAELLTGNSGTESERSSVKSIAQNVPRKTVKKVTQTVSKKKSVKASDQADKKNSSSSSEEEDASSESSQGKSEFEGTESTDDLWAVEAQEGIGSAGLVDFENNRPKSRFNWDRLERKADSDKIFIEHHGYFRFRADMLHNFDLGTYDRTNRLGTSQYLPPLTDREGGNQKDSDSLSTANIRFRYAPTLHITEQFKVYATMDLPDNLVLGSTPDGGPLSINQRPDALFDGLSGTQTPIDDGVRIRHVWGVWENSFARFVSGCGVTKCSFFKW